MSPTPNQLEQTIDHLPTFPGVYALVLTLGKSERLSVGRFGEVDLLPGTYVYFGSARGPGGIRARLGRHLQGDGKTHWHIDHLRAAANVDGVCWAVVESDQRWECEWTQAVGRLAGVSVPVAGFGASDCRSGCGAHLLRFERLTCPVLQSTLQAVTPTEVSYYKLSGML